MADFYAIVAEYRDVALLEKRGSKRAVWQGQEYLTDGMCYVPWTEGDEHGAFAFNSEREAKVFIDAVLDEPGQIQSKSLNDITFENLLTYRDVYQLLYGKPLVGKPPMYAFNGQAGVFVHIEGVAQDGQHRHGGLNG